MSLLQLVSNNSEYFRTDYATEIQSYTCVTNTSQSFHHNSDFFHIECLIIPTDISPTKITSFDIIINNQTIISIPYILLFNISTITIIKEHYYIKIPDYLFGPSIIPEIPTFLIPLILMSSLYTRIEYLLKSTTDFGYEMYTHNYLFNKNFRTNYMRDNSTCYLVINQYHSDPITSSKTIITPNLHSDGHFIYINQSITHYMQLLNNFVRTSLNDYNIKYYNLKIKKISNWTPQHTKVLKTSLKILPKELIMIIISYLDTTNHFYWFPIDINQKYTNNASKSMINYSTISDVEINITTKKTPICGNIYTRSKNIIRIIYSQPHLAFK
jgi:hypothetical protein